MINRVVITGLGVVAPNAIGIKDFKKALLEGRSGIKYYPELKDLGFRCQLGAIPNLNNAVKEEFIRKYSLIKLKSTGIIYGCMAGIEAWYNAGLQLIDNKKEIPDWDSGCIIGTGSSGVEAIDYGMKLVNKGDVKKMGGRTAQQAMNSGVSAYLGGILGLGNQVTTNSSAGNTGAEAILMAYNRIKYGLAKRMIAGSSESDSPYIWGAYDSMKTADAKKYALAQGYNKTPELASCPLSNRTSGFVPGSGAGALVLESLESALERNAKIYGEIVGGHINSGGQRGDGSMIVNDKDAMVRCIQKALQESKVTSSQVDLIAGQLSSNALEVNEIQSCVLALDRSDKKFPLVNSTASMIGYCFSASGAIETVAAVMQLHHDFVHPSLNAENLHPEIAAVIDASKVPKKTLRKKINVVVKISYGLGDVNACIVLKKWGGQ
jgi:3-oxoacyl-[acyl-carrier-protein] synthase-1